MTSATLSGATITGAQFSKANFTQLIAVGVTGAAHTLPTGWRVISGYLIGPKVNLQNAVLTGLNFTGVNLTGAIFYKATLTNVNFTKANLTSVYLGSATLVHCTMTKAVMTGATMTSIISSRLVGLPAKFPAGYGMLGGSFTKTLGPSLG